MALFYSPSRNAFFEDSVHSVMPDDVRPITQEAHTAVMNATCEGLVLAADENGDPIAVPPPSLSDDQLSRQVRGQRDRLLTACDWTQMPDVPFTDEQRAAWAEYRQALRDIPETTSDMAAVEWPAAPNGKTEA